MNPAQPVAPLPAASLLVVRDRERPEFLLLKRGVGARFMPGAHVFPGGVVDAADRAAPAFDRCMQLDDAAASRVLSVAATGLSYYIAAIRECFEECGLLLASNAAGEPVDVASGCDCALAELRARLREGPAGLIDLCAERGWWLATDRLVYFSHWITPEDSPLRFDARFFIARAPERQRPSLVGGEMSALRWLSAADALAQSARGELLIWGPTAAMLRELTPFDDVDALLAAMRAPRSIVAR